MYGGSCSDVEGMELLACMRSVSHVRGDVRRRPGAPCGSKSRLRASCISRESDPTASDLERPAKYPGSEVGAP